MQNLGGQTKRIMVFSEVAQRNMQNLYYALLSFISMLQEGKQLHYFNIKMQSCLTKTFQHKLFQHQHA